MLQFAMSLYWAYSLAGSVLMEIVEMLPVHDTLLRSAPHVGLSY